MVRQTRHFGRRLALLVGELIPQFVIDAPGGGGKIPINPETIVSHDNNQIVVRNYEGKEFEYPEIPSPEQS